MRLAGLLLPGAFAIGAWAKPPVPVRDPQAAAVRELVELTRLDAGLRFNLRYATPVEKHPPLDDPLDQLP